MIARMMPRSSTPWASLPASRREGLISYRIFPKWWINIHHPLRNSAGFCEKTAIPGAIGVKIALPQNRVGQPVGWPNQASFCKPGRFRRATAGCPGRHHRRHALDRAGHRPAGSVVVAPFASVRGIAPGFATSRRLHCSLHFGGCWFAACRWPIRRPTSSG